MCALRRFAGEYRNAVLQCGQREAEVFLDSQEASGQADDEGVFPQLLFYMGT